MTLEPVLPSLDDEATPELADFTRRFWWTLPLTVVVTVLAMFGHQFGWMAMGTQRWVELVLTVPIVLWAGWPFFVHGTVADRADGGHGAARAPMQRMADAVAGTFVFGVVTVALLTYFGWGLFGPEPCWV